MATVNKCTWETIIQNDWYKEVAPFYSKEFPVEIRSMLSDWLSKDNSFMSFNLDENDHRKYALAFVETLLHELWDRINAASSEGEANFHHKQRLLKLHKRIQALDRLHLFNVIRDTLNHEKQRVQNLSVGKASPGTKQGQTPGTNDRSFSRIQEEIDSVLTYIQLKCQEIDYKIPEQGNTLQTWNYNLYRFQQSQRQQNLVNGNINVYDIDPIPSEEELRNKSSKLSKDIRTLYEFVVEVMGLLDSSVHEKVLKELEKWRDDQRLVALGKPIDNTLEAIEKWFKIMSSCLATLERRLPEFMQICQEQKLIDEANSVLSIIERIENLQQAMVNVSLVISKEPKQIIRTGPNFGPVRLNVLPFCTNMMITAVKAVFINEKTANEYFSKPNNTHQELPTKCGDLKFAKSDPHSSKNKIEYQTVTVTKVAKNAKRGEQFVVEEKFWIYFRVTVSYKKKSIFLYTTSLPISVTSHPVQEGKAWAHVVWYNAFPLKMRQRFEVPEFIQWSRLIETINYAFLVLGKGLTDEQKDYLKSKIFKGNVPSSEMVSKGLFVTDIIATIQPDPSKPEDEKSIKQYTYGEWLHCCLKLISWVPKNGKYAEFGVRKFWSEDRIIGFMSKEEIEKRLRGSSPGTFILRFPENRPENICLYFHDPSVDSKDHLLKQLLSINDFKTKTLQDRILENSAAVYLYPSTPKGDVFTKMSKSDCSTVDGYFNVDVQENIPSIILQRIKQAQVTPSNGDVFNPCSRHSHSALSYHTSQYGIANSPSTESVYSDYSSTTGSYTAFSPCGIDPRILDLDDELNLH